MQTGLLVCNVNNLIYDDSDERDREMIKLAKNQFEGVLFRLVAILDLFMSKDFDYKEMPNIQADPDIYPVWKMLQLW